MASSVSQATRARTFPQTPPPRRTCWQFFQRCLRRETPPASVGLRGVHAMHLTLPRREGFVDGPGVIQAGPISIQVGEMHAVQASLGRRRDSQAFETEVNPMPQREEGVCVQDLSELGVSPSSDRERVSTEEESRGEPVFFGSIPIDVAGEAERVREEAQLRRISDVPFPRRRDSSVFPAEIRPAQGGDVELGGQDAEEDIGELGEMDEEILRRRKAFAQSRSVKGFQRRQKDVEQLPGSVSSN